MKDRSHDDAMAELFAVRREPRFCEISSAAP